MDNAGRRLRLRFVILMTDTWRVKCCIILTYNDRDVTHLHMMMILSGAWPQATAWQGPSAACGRKASDGTSRPAGPGYGLREIQGRESSGGAASDIY